MNIEFPIEFIVRGTPVSQRAKLALARDEWKARVKDASAAVIPNPHFASDARMAVTLYYLPIEAMLGDIDNIIKPVLDALTTHIYLDDQQVERLVVQKFEPEQTPALEQPSATLREAWDGPRPLLYVRITDDPNEEPV